MAPVILRAGTLNATSDLTLSQNHRVLVAGQAAELLLGTDEVLVPAKSLVNGETIVCQPIGFVTYAHLMFDRHQIIFANDCLTESLYPGQGALGFMDPDQLSEIQSLFPELATEAAPVAEPARHFAKHFEGSVLAKLI